MTGSTKNTDERMILLFLGGISLLCISGIIALEVFADGVQSDALLTIGSLCVGALASRFTGTGGRHASQRSTDDPDQDAFEIIGRAATKQIINDALRKMEGSAD